ncbi:ABC transporter permease [Natranaerobius thermophilus]|uniref:Binding-protein-dependent transport systems inner membrane component n=1 Tax=Natranaerobius thermophilus (strain ATCC BAA-1301 / DSM 18059 / JW/NM-WN-LF) TaxID=457570 RepID=B2A3U1_NATTJ|nr:ABC transporter permease [Natranaerobius thermophilus]ACB83717.1 binding-protein-dependent transport systems inner membrane component [Natranaerobius thermophilus JW/NM-WN-LF]
MGISTSILEFWQYLVDRQDMFLNLFYEHTRLILITAIISIIIGVILGLVSTYYKSLANIILTVTQILMTIPSLAMIAIIFPLFGIGPTTGIVALVLYSLLPIVRNTYTGINELDANVLEAAKGMGMSERKILLKIKIPLALPVIIAGIRTAVVMVVGIGAIASLIGAGGLGDFIFRGISRDFPFMILAGAIGVSILAIALDLLLSWLEQKVIARQS